jgi:prepilin peptidase CpaA
MVLGLNKIVLIVLLILSVKYDVTERRIPNKLTIPVILWGIVTAGIFSGFNGILFSISGFLVGLAVFFVPFVMGGMGAGDVKLMAAVGSILGWKLTVYSALLTAIAGGIIVIGYTIYTGKFVGMIKNMGIHFIKWILYVIYLATHSDDVYPKYKSVILSKSYEEKTYIPYGVAIAVGTLIVLGGNYFGYTPFK